MERDGAGLPVRQQRDWPDIFLTLRPSPTLTVYIVSSHLLVLLPLPWLDLAVGTRLLILLVVLTSGWSALSMHAWRRRADAICQLHWFADGRLLLRQVDGHWREGMIIEDDRFVHPRLVVMACRRQRRWQARRYLVLCPDMCSVEGFRRLRVRLRFDSPGPSPVGADGSDGR